MKKLISAVLIVRNEAKSIKAVLESAKLCCDKVTIIDTGSTDDTIKLIHETLADFPHNFFERPFRGFKDSRNEMLDLDRENGEPTEFQVMLSGDEYIRDGEKLRVYLENQRATDIGIHFIRLILDSGLEYQARIFRTGSPWRYDDFGLGIHEVPVWTGGEPSGPISAFAGAHIDHDVSDPIARMDNIWENHIPMLWAVTEKDPTNGRAWEYLAQSYEAFLPHMEEEERKQTAAMCMNIYHKRFELPFDTKEQKNFLMMRYVDDARLTDVLAPEEQFVIADTLYKSDPTRPETALLRAVIASTCTTKLASDVYNLAVEAAKVGEEVRLKGGLNNSAPLDMATEWKAHRLAAVAAKQLSSKHAEYIPLVRDHIKNGMALGGPWFLFKDILGATATPDQLDTLG